MRSSRDGAARRRGPRRRSSANSRSTHPLTLPTTVHTIPLDGNWKVNGWCRRKMAGETEKLTLNLGPVDPGQTDLLVQEGFYSNRTDFIRTAIRNQLATHAEVV